jgi:hypothetical protein
MRDEAVQAAMNARLHGLIDSVADRVEPVLPVYLHDMIEANEGAIALEIAAAALLEGGGRITASQCDEAFALAAQLGVNRALVEGLTALVDVDI